jgi:ATP-dependent DNA helicase RecQ
MLNDWMKDKARIMVATNAFGMGIDKPNVRFVIHYEIPNNIEAYYQEAGRAGRDGLPAVAIAFVSQRDQNKLKEQLEINYPSTKDMTLIYRALCNHLKIAISSGKDETYEIDLSKLCKQFNLTTMNAYYCLKALQLNGNLQFNDSFFSPTKLKFSIGNTELYSFQVRNERVNQLISMLSRTYPGIFDLFFEINEDEFTKRLSISKEELEKQLQYLEKMGVIDIKWRTTLPTVTFLRERPAHDQIFWNGDQYFNLKVNASYRLAQMLGYLQGDQCRNQMILRYFGQENNACLKCDNCLKILESRTTDEIEKTILSQLTAPRTLNELSRVIGISIEETEEYLKPLLLDKKAILLDDKFIKN